MCASSLHSSIQNLGDQRSRVRRKVLKCIVREQFCDRAHTLLKNTSVLAFTVRSLERKGTILHETILYS